MTNINNYDFSRYKIVSKIGLTNLEDTSYFNAVLQCFRNIYNIANYFLDPNNTNNIKQNNNPLSFVIATAFQHLFPYPETDEKREFNTEDIFKILKKISIYKSYHKKPPNDFLLYFLRTIHEELKKKDNNSSNEIMDNNKELNLREKTIKKGLSKYMEKSIISNNFSYYNLKEYICSQCENIKYEFKSFNTFDLNISKYNKSDNKNNLTIYECLKKLSQIDNIIYCQECKDKMKFVILNRIYSSPNIFIFILDRKNMDEELIKISFNIEEKIDLNSFIEDKNSPKKYELIGVVSISMREKKYIAFSRSPINKNWYLFNDSEVHPIDLNFVIKSHNRFNFYTPCILFYESIKNNSINNNE